MKESNKKIILTRNVLPILSLDDVKLGIAVFGREHDDYLKNLILVGIQYAEAQLGYLVNPYNVDYYFEADKTLCLSDKNQDIESVSFYDLQNQLIKLSPSDYIVDSTGRKPTVTITGEFVLTRDLSNAYVVRTLVKIPLDAINAIRQAIIMYIGGIFWDKTERNEKAVMNLLLPYRKVFT